MDDFPSDVLAMKAALRAQLGSKRRKQSGSFAGRRALEKRAMAPHDGRLKTIAECRVQLNVEIREELKERLDEARRDHRRTSIEIVERGIELAIAELEAKGARNA